MNLSLLRSMVFALLSLLVTGLVLISTPAEAKENRWHFSPPPITDPQLILGIRIALGDYGQPVSDYGESHLQSIPAITIHDPASLDGISRLSNLLRLIVVFEEPCKLTDLAEIADCERLTFLEIHGAAADFLALLPPATLERLTTLTIPGIEGATLPGAADLKKLERLDAPGSRFNTLNFVKELPQLQVLGLRDSRIESLAPLEQRTRLTEIDLANTRLTDHTPLLKLAKNRPHTMIPLIVNLSGVTMLGDASFPQVIEALETTGMEVRY